MFLQPVLQSKSTKNYEFVSAALVTQHAMRTRYNVTCGLLRPIQLTTLFHKRHDFRKQLLNIKCFDFLHNSVQNISHSNKN
jgi:hypothetical protein